MATWPTRGEQPWDEQLQIYIDDSTKDSVVAGDTKWAASSPVRQNVVADYTGRYGTPGAGTDARSAIQAALNAASQRLDSSWYSYLKRRAVTVTLPAGVYLIGAPPTLGSSSLTIPEGVTLDASKAMLFFDYPDAPTGGWSGILIRQSASLIAPAFMAPSGRNTAPAAPGTSNTPRLYDGVRLLGNDNGTSHVDAKGAAEIKGFAGASIRSIGTWVTRINGAIKLSSSHGYIASNWPATNVYGYTHPAGMEGLISGVRLHTDLYISGPYFNENRYGGFLGVVSGDPAAPHTIDISRSGGFQMYFKETVFEHFAALALTFSGSVFSLTDCAFEEVGNGSTGMAALNNVQSAIISNLRVNYTGMSVPGPSGNTSPFNPNVFTIASVQSLIWEGGYVRNTYNAAMRLFDAAANRFRVYPPRTDSNAFPAGPMLTGLAAAFSGGYTTGINIRGSYLWVDVNGVLRIKATAPTSDLDGVAVGSQT